MSRTFFQGKLSWDNGSWQRWRMKDAQVLPEQLILHSVTQGADRQTEVVGVEKTLTSLSETWLLP